MPSIAEVVSAAHAAAQAAAKAKREARDKPFIVTDSEYEDSDSDTNRTPKKTLKVKRWGASGDSDKLEALIRGYIALEKKIDWARLKKTFDRSVPALKARWVTIQTQTGQAQAKGGSKKRWTTAEKETLIDMRVAQSPWSDIATAVGRAAGACRSHYYAHLQYEEYHGNGHHIGQNGQPGLVGAARGVHFAPQIDGSPGPVDVKPNLAAADVGVGGGADVAATADGLLAQGSHELDQQTTLAQDAQNESETLPKRIHSSGSTSLDSGAVKEEVQDASPAPHAKRPRTDVSTSRSGKRRVNPVIHDDDSDEETTPSGVDKGKKKAIEVMVLDSDSDSD
ncbi:hypothetical protein RQP46_000392 [Phenoliferia psychrophenolica]